MPDSLSPDLLGKMHPYSSMPRTAAQATGAFASFARSKKSVHFDMGDLPIRQFRLDRFSVSTSVFQSLSASGAGMTFRPQYLPSSSFSPRATIIKASSGKGR